MARGYALSPRKKENGRRGGGKREREREAEGAEEGLLSSGFRLPNLN